MSRSRLSGVAELRGRRRSVSVLVLADGETFEGEAIGADGRRSRHGEVVFNTALSGYQEIITDPSYAGQIITFTYPHIGNYGVNPTTTRAAARSVAASSCATRPPPSNWRATERPRRLPARATACPASAGIDTRRLTRHIREAGALPGAFGTDERRELRAAAADARHRRHRPRREGHHRRAVHGRRPDAPFHVVAYDFGIKRRSCATSSTRGARSRSCPRRPPAADVLAREPDGVFLSNGRATRPR